MSETIALFGGNGRTGKEFLKLALEGGFVVKSLVRNPAKLSDERHEHLTLIEGDFENLNAVEEVVRRADYVVCMAAAAVGENGMYPKGYMLDFIQRLYHILLKSSPKVFLYQAGSMSVDGNGFLHPVAWAMKQTLGRKLKIIDKIDDNDAAIRYIGAQHSIPFIVTRAGVLEEGPRKKTAKLSKWFPPLPWFPVTYADLAACSLHALKEESVYNTFPFVS